MNKNVYWFVAGFLVAVLLFWFAKPQTGRYQAISVTALVDTAKGRVLIWDANQRRWKDNTSY